MAKRRRGELDDEEVLQEILFGISTSLTHEHLDNALPSSRGEPVTSAWKDDDDEAIEVDLSKTNRLRKLSRKTSASKVSGAVLSNLLHDRFQSSPLEWASTNTDTKSSDEVSELLRHSAALVSKSSNVDSDASLLPGKIHMLRKADGNIADPSSDKVTAVRWHGSGSLLLAAGLDKQMRFFKVDGDRNEKQLSVRFSDMAITDAHFLGHSNEVIAGGRKPFYYSYDISSGAVNKISGIMGKRVKSFEQLCVNSLGSTIAVVGSGGYAHLCSGKHKTWIADVKINCPIRSLAFAGDHELVTAGLDAEVYWWDLRMTSKCLRRFLNEDGTCCSSLAVSPTVGALAVGSESGVVSLYADGLPGNDLSTGTSPMLSKSFTNLRTKVDSICFHPSSQLLAIASSEMNDQLRLVHVASRTVYSNWPTESTPLRKLQCCAFSPGGGYLAVGNNIGKVLLYRVQHFADA